MRIDKSIQEIPNYPGWFAMVKIQSHYMLEELAEALAEAYNHFRDCNLPTSTMDSSLGVTRAMAMLVAWSFFAQPGSIQDFFCKSAVDMGADQCFKCVLNLFVFFFAEFGSLLRQIPFGHEVAEQLRIRTVRYAYHIVETM